MALLNLYLFKPLWFFSPILLTTRDRVMMLSIPEIWVWPAGTETINSNSVDLLSFSIKKILILDTRIKISVSIGLYIALYWWGFYSLHIRRFNSYCKSPCF